MLVIQNSASWKIHPTSPSPPERLAEHLRGKLAVLRDGGGDDADEVLAVDVAGGRHRQDHQLDAGSTAGRNASAAGSGIDGDGDDDVRVGANADSTLLAWRARRTRPRAGHDLDAELVEHRRRAGLDSLDERRVLVPHERRGVAALLHLGDLLVR